MKKKTKIVVATTAVAITSLMITAYNPEPVNSPVSPQIAPVLEVVGESKTCTTPTVTEPIVAEEIIEISTQAEKITKPTHQRKNIVIEDEKSSPQPTEKNGHYPDTPHTNGYKADNSTTFRTNHSKNGRYSHYRRKTAKLFLRIRLGRLHGR